MILLCADIHTGIHKSNEYFYKTTINLFEEIADVCSKRNIKRIAHLGDLFENRRIISQKTLDVVRKCIEICKDAEIILIRGNHDTYYNDHPHPNWITSLKEYSNVITVEDKPLFLDDYCFVPYGYDISNLDWNKYLLGHFSINSFPMNDGYVCNDGFEPSSYSKFKHVFSGHFHFPSSKNNITYLGSPFHHNFGDVDSIRGYYILDDKLEFIEFTSAPKFYKIHTDTFTKDKHKITGNFIKLIFDADYGSAKNTEYVEETERLNPLSIVVDTTKLGQYSVVKNEDLVHFDDAETLFFNYLESQDIPEHLNKKLLFRLVNSLWKENNGN
jgi:DNA repair exonuclease SbcCD nuclease subunit